MACWRPSHLCVRSGVPEKRLKRASLHVETTNGSLEAKPCTHLHGRHPDGRNGQRRSAARMAPEHTAPDKAADLATGGSFNELCGEGSSHEKHHCPSYRLLSDPPDIHVAPCVRRATPALVWRNLGHLVARARAGNPPISARASPALL